MLPEIIENKFLIKFEFLHWGFAACFELGKQKLSAPLLMVAAVQ